MVDEINDETDDSLEHYSEYIITQALSGKQLPENDNGTNNSYHITEVTARYAAGRPAVQFLDENIYIQSRMETEPARIYKTIFKNSGGRYYELTVMVPSFEKNDLKTTILYWIVALYILLLPVIIGVNAIIIRRSMKPLYIMLKWLDKLTLQKKIPPLNIESDIAEFRKLADTLRRNAERNAELYEQQSLFTGHASHELQTPIAIAQNRLEILADESGLNEHQLQQVLQTKRSLENIAKLNKTLLLLTKIENKQFPDSKEININRLLNTLATDFSEAYGYLEIDARINDNANILINMNETLAYVLFSNLIKNAYTHNCKNGKVSVIFTPGSIRISNTAVYGALNPAYIYRRFYKGSKKEGSTGLGLSLADAICKRYNMNISYIYEDGMHHFTVQIPDHLT
jgi:signal transduction histidine kinase